MISVQVDTATIHDGGEATIHDSCCVVHTLHPTPFTQLPTLHYTLIPTPVLHHVLTPEVSLAEKALRTVAVYCFLLIGLRLAGKRELGQINPFDLVVLLV